MLQKTFGSTSSYIGFAKKSIWIKVEVNDESYFVHKIKDFQSLNKCYIKVCIYYQLPSPLGIQNCTPFQ